MDCVAGEDGVPGAGERVNGWRGVIGMASELGMAAGRGRGGALRGVWPRIAPGPEAGRKDRGGSSLESGPARKGG
jgi:hypothetical protein